MHGTPADLRDATQLSALEASHEELRPWLRPLARALDALARAPWHGLTPVLAQHAADVHATASGRAPGEAGAVESALPWPDAAGAATRAGHEPGSAGAAGTLTSSPGTGDVPLLHGALLPIERRALAALAHAILGETVGEGVGRRVDPVGLLEAAVAHDDAAVQTLAAEVGIEPQRLAAAGQLLALPALQACGRALERAGARPRGWTRGYCPICGALPTLVEVRGLERARALRCARCGAAWSTEVLLCAFCGERDHERLGSLVPEGDEGRMRWVETCAACGGYLKARAMLRGLAPTSVILEDASTIHLDLVAVERGFQRPRRPGFAVRVRVAPARAAA